MNKVWLSYPKQRNRKPKTKFKSLQRRLFLEYNPKDNMNLNEKVGEKKWKDPCWKLNGAVESSLPLESPQALRCYGAVTEEHLDF